MFQQLEKFSRTVALMVWESTNYRLKERDEYVGSTPALYAACHCQDQTAPPSCLFPFLWGLRPQWEIKENP